MISRLKGIDSYFSSNCRYETIEEGVEEEEEQKE
jgi:hypothetical protein